MSEEKDIQGQDAEQDFDPTPEDMFGPDFAGTPSATDEPEGATEEPKAAEEPEEKADADEGEQATETPAEESKNADGEPEPQEETPRKLGTWNGIEFTTEHIPPGVDEQAFIAMLTQANQATHYQQLYEQAARMQQAQPAAQPQTAPQPPQQPQRGQPSMAEAIKADVEAYMPVVEQLGKELPEELGVGAFAEDFPGVAAIMAKHEAMLGALVQQVQPVIQKTHVEAVQSQFFNTIRSIIPDQDENVANEFLQFLGESEFMKTAPPEMVFDQRFPSVIDFHWKAFLAERQKQKAQPEPAKMEEPPTETPKRKPETPEVAATGGGKPTRPKPHTELDEVKEMFPGFLS